MSICLRRREFIAALGGAAVWPLAARAQRAAVPVIGFLNAASAWEYSRFADAYRQALSEAGYVEGRTVLIEYRWAEGRYERLKTLADQLVRRQVDVIFANAPAFLAAKAATNTIPIVFLTGGDPVELGLVESLNRPGANLTGVGNLNVEVGPKRLELLHEVTPTVSIALLVNPASANAEGTTRSLRNAAQRLGVNLRVLEASTEIEINSAFTALSDQRAGALVIGSDSFFNSRSEQLATLALRYAIPAIYQYRGFASAGGLMSYGNDLAESYRLAGVYTGRILKGEKPADLPVMQATRVELVINLKTAKALGLTVPLTLLALATEVIE